MPRHRYVHYILAFMLKWGNPPKKPGGMVAASAAIRSGDLVNTASSIRFGPILVFCATIYKTENVVLFLPQLVCLGN